MIIFFLNLETLVQFNGSKLVYQRPTKTSKANPQPQPEVPADHDIRVDSTPRQQNFQPNRKRVTDTDEDSESNVATFETPRVLLKKTKEKSRASQ